MYFDHQVVFNQRLNKKFNLIRFRTLSKDFTFKIGQFVLFTISKNISRAYSIASVPKGLPYWEIFVDITPGGPGTTYLKSLKKGERVITSTARGQFLLDEGSKNYVFGATGCGIAPFLPMINELIKRRNSKIYLFWGLRNESDIALSEKMAWIKHPNRNCSISIVLSKPSPQWKGVGGHITLPLITKTKALPPKETKIYLSGSNDFVHQASEALKKEKIEPKSIYLEACY